MDEKCFCHLNGYAVKDATARKDIADAKTRLENAESTLLQAQETIASVQSKITKRTKTLPTYYYVAKTGSDENDGLSPETPFETIEKFFDLLNGGCGEVRCYITEPGEYDISYNMFTHSAMHIIGYVDGVVLNFVEDTWGDGIVFYHCHSNFKNLTIKAPNEEIRFETGVCLFDSVTFECKQLRLFQIYLECDETFTAPNLYLFGCSGRVKNLHITGTSGNAVNMDRGNNIRFYGDMVVADREPGNSDIIFNCLNSVLYLVINTITGSGWSVGVHNYGSLIFLHQSPYNDFVEASDEAVSTDKSIPGVFVKASQTIGGDYS